MSQLSFTEAEFTGKRARREKFLSDMHKTAPWEWLAGKIAKHYPQPGKGGRQPYPIETMLRIHFMRQWFSSSDPAVDEALYNSFSMCQFAKLPGGRVPDETTILNFRHLLKANDIAEEIFEGANLLLQDYGLMVRRGTIVSATIIGAPSSTKNVEGKRALEMHQTKKGNTYFFGMKAHIGVDMQTGLMHAVVGTPANMADVTQVDCWLHGDEALVLGDAGDQSVGKRKQHQGRKVQWFVAVRPNKLAQVKRGPAKAQTEIEFMKASLRAKVEHPFRVIKRQFGYTKVRYWGLTKNTAQIKTLFALANLWMARGRLT